MSDVAEQAQTSSNVALYRGLIALAWADHELHPDEKSTLHDIIDNHIGLTDEDRTKLHSEVERRVSLSSVWPDITDPQHRARLIDMANIIFQQDGDFSDAERDLIETFRVRHLNSIDIDAVRADMSGFMADHAEKLEAEREEIRAWASQYGLIGSLKKAFSTKLF